MEKQKDEKMRRINELKKQLEELEKAQDHEDEEMLVDEDGEEKYDEAEWAEYEAQQDAWTSQTDEKGTSSKDSSYIFVESTKTHQKLKKSN